MKDKLYLGMIGALACCLAFWLGVAVTSTRADLLAKTAETEHAQKEAAREERFLDECEWGPRAGVQADGTPLPRKPNLSFPLCYQELVKARTITAVTTFPASPPAPPTQPPPSAPKK